MILLIHPRDPLIVRDGRPFSAFPGAKIRGYAFPPPQVTAGAIRSRIGLYCGYGSGAGEKWLRLLQTVKVSGPTLFSLDHNEALYPAPLDALLLKAGEAEEGGFDLFRLSPKPVEEGVLTNLPGGLEHPVSAPSSMHKRKPEAMPAFWRNRRFFDWLEWRPAESQKLKAPSELGISGPDVTYRTHVKVDPITQTAEESMLYETSGLSFLHSNRSQSDGSIGSLGQIETLALLLAVDGELPDGCAGTLEEAFTGVFPLGGERRLALWEVGRQRPFNKLPSSILDEIKKAKKARVVLLTPADFNTDGNDAPFLPEGGYVDGAKVVAAAVGRPLTVSGWDMLAGAPKPSRRLAPAGSVYFVDLSSVKDIEKWVKDRWMQVLAEQPEQSRHDGYGQAVLGVWR